MMKSDILIVGPLENKVNPQKTGGAIVLFTNLVEELNKQNIKYVLIDTNKENYSNILFAYFSILLQIFIKQFKVQHISLHSSGNYIFIMPFIIIIGKLFKKSTSLRKFGGEAWSNYNSSRGIKKILLGFIFQNVDYLFLEMKFLVNHFIELNKNTFWFPNVRIKPNIELKEKTVAKKFVFISQLFQEKGVDEILEVSNQLPGDYIIDLYGPIKDEKYTDEYFTKYKAKYCGTLKSNEVLDTLKNYDILLLPTYYKGEGYPGIVIESYSMGIPVIVTKLIGIKEITDEYRTGILIEAKNIEMLKNAIIYFNTNNYEQMSKYAKEKFSLFNSEKQTKVFLDKVLSS